MGVIYSFLLCCLTTMFGGFMATSMSLSHESNEAHEVEWPEDGEGDIQLLDENVFTGWLIRSQVRRCLL